MSSWNQRGHDITFESLTFGNRPKVVLQGYAPTGFDVFNSVKNVSLEADESAALSGTMHYHGSMIAFPYGCFLWNIKSAQEVTVESLAPMKMYRPALEYLFLGVEGSSTIPPSQLQEIKDFFAKQNTVVEVMGISNAMGTFNILNAEDREVGAAFVLDPSQDADSQLL